MFKNLQRLGNAADWRGRILSGKGGGGFPPAFRPLGHSLGKKPSPRAAGLPLGARYNINCNN